MVPLKLLLRNFMCYRDNVPPLNLEGIHVACLTGNNGNGKSALLDAMTWALWGQARAKDDELIHLGRSEMEVELEFAAGGRRYRAIRKRARPRPGRPGHTILELHGAGEDGRFSPITGNTLRDTQRKINTEILHMDYDTFINSAFLLQGRADEFTTRAPAERKKVLAEILGISRYDDWEEEARTRARKKEGETQELQGEIKSLDQELARTGEYQQEVRQTKEAVDRLEEERSALESAINNLQEAKKLLDIKSAQRDEARRSVDRAWAELRELEGEQEKRQIAIARYQATVAQKEEIERGVRELGELKNAERKLSDALGQLLTLSQEKNRLERTMDSARGELVSQLRVLHAELERLEKKASPSNRSRLERELKDAEVKLKELAQEELAVSEARRRTQELSTRIQLLQSANEGLMEEMKDLRAKVDLLASPQAGAEARCPVCGSVLDPEGRQRLTAQYERGGMVRKEDYLANERSLREAQRGHQGAQSDITHREESFRREQAIRQATIAALERELKEMEEAEASMVEFRPRIDGLEARLSEEDFTHEERVALREVDRHIESLGYDRQEHERLRNELSQKEVYDALSRELEVALGDLPVEREALAHLEETARRQRNFLEEETARCEALSRELEALPELARKLAVAQRSLGELQGRLGETQVALGVAQQKLENCRQLEGIKKEKTAAQKKAQDEKTIYDELTLAFGKRGIQAMIIEDALPELEEEANSLLGRITDQRMALKLETQRMRATGKGEPIETLDIKISDELGTRSYELYSGGEAFRVNFALRIALSKILARRAGAPLPTLIIDEGFGTQDSSGREKLVDAINSIQDDFERILVITHLDELKEAFPVRIEVTKTPEGSTFAIT